MSDELLDIILEIKHKSINILSNINIFIQIEYILFKIYFIINPINIIKNEISNIKHFLILFDLRDPGFDKQKNILKK